MKNDILKQLKGLFSNGGGDSGTQNLDSFDAQDVVLNDESYIEDLYVVGASAVEDSIIQKPYVCKSQMQ